MLPCKEKRTLAQWREGLTNPLEMAAEIRQRVNLCFFQPQEDIDPSRKLLHVAEGLRYIHSEGVVHGDLCGVLDPKDNASKY